MHTSTPYDTDYNLWLCEQLAALREGQFATADWENIIEELDSLGKSEKRSLESYLENLLMHLLKYQYQPQKRSRSWLLTILNARTAIRRSLKASPSLKPYLAEALAEVYQDARRAASVETGKTLEIFPAKCPYPMEQILDPDFLP